MCSHEYCVIVLLEEGRPCVGSNSSAQLEEVGGWCYCRVFSLSLSLRWHQFDNLKPFACWRERKVWVKNLEGASSFIVRSIDNLINWHDRFKERSKFTIMSNMRREKQANPLDFELRNKVSQILEVSCVTVHWYTCQCATDQAGYLALTVGQPVGQVTNLKLLMSWHVRI